MAADEAAMMPISWLLCRVDERPNLTDDRLPLFWRAAGGSEGAAVTELDNTGGPMRRRRGESVCMDAYVYRMLAVFPIVLADMAEAVPASCRASSSAEISCCRPPSRLRKAAGSCSTSPSRS